MAIGDAAAAAGMNIVDGATTEARTIDTEINRTRDYLAETRTELDTKTADVAKIGHKHAAADITSGTLPVNRGGTGRTNIGDHTRGDVGNGGYGLVAVRESDGALFRAVGALAPGYIGGAAVADADRVTAAAYGREAGASRYAMWMDGGRYIGRATSTRRHKSDITPHEFDIPALLSIPVVSFIRDVDQDAGTRDIGLIAEDLDGAGLAELVDYGDDGVVDGIRDHRLVYALLATVQRQATELDLLAQRLAALEVHHAGN